MHRMLNIGFVFLVLFLLMGSVLAEPNSYMQYQEPKAASTSLLSTIAYVISLIITFVVVIGLAYFASRFLGKKFGQIGRPYNNRLLATIPFGTNRSVVVIDIAGKVLLLGVTDHNISLLQEITDPEKIAALKAEQKQLDEEISLNFGSQFEKLQKMTQQFPQIFGQDWMKQNGKREKR